MRKLGIPTVLDRLIQQAIHQILVPIFDPGFSESSYGFRPGRSAHQAVQRTKEYHRQRKEWCVDFDIEKFFDRVNHDILMSRIARKIKDKRVLHLIRLYLQAGAMIGGIESPREEGTPQGSPLSPLLSNIYLDEFDKELEKRGHTFCRYADDCNIYVRSEKAGLRVMKSIQDFLKKKLKLNVNGAKSKVGKTGGRKFLGFTIEKRMGTTRIRIATKAISRFKDKIRYICQRGRGRKMEETINKDLKPVLRGWINYFKLTDAETMLGKLDSWIRRKLRKIIWEQLKRRFTRAKELAFSSPKCDKFRFRSTLIKDLYGCAKL